jgi:2,3-bisphosphoglycerate-dependent phosphoglycerate mutase
MHFYFIRHAQSENNALWLETGTHRYRTEDPDLTPTGYEQARLLARHLARSPMERDLPVADWNPQNIDGFGITHLYCSLMVRAVATGTVVAQVLGLPLVAWADLHEAGGLVEFDNEIDVRTGLPGHNRAYFETRYPDLVLPDSLGEEGWWNRPYEEREQRPVRARRVLRELLDRHGDTEDRVAIISHGAFFYYLMNAILDLPPEPPRWFYMENTAITRINFSEEGIALVYSNSTSHLPREMVT